MSFIFTGLGVIFAAVGGLWIGAMFQNMPSSGAGVLGALIAAAPGLGVFISGILFLAVASVLHHLNRIERNTANTVYLLEQMRGGQ